MHFLASSTKVFHLHCWSIPATYVTILFMLTIVNRKAVPRADRLPNGVQTTAPRRSGSGSGPGTLPVHRAGAFATRVIA